MSESDATWRAPAVVLNGVGGGSWRTGYGLASTVRVIRIADLVAHEDEFQSPFSPELAVGPRALGAVCPHLGLADDRATHALFATEEHRCYVAAIRRIEPDHQRRFCLTDRFGACPLGAQPERPADVAGAPKRAELTEASKQPARSMSLKRLVVATSAATVLTVAAVLTVSHTWA